MTETYAYLIKLGVDRGYKVIPEFVVNVDGQIRKIDLVFAKKKDVIDNDIELLNLRAWHVYYAIEIEGVDVQFNRINNHKETYIYLNNQDAQVFQKGISIIYLSAYHRPKWNRNPSLFNMRRERFISNENYNKDKMMILRSDNLNQLDNIILNLQ